MVEVNKLHILR